MDILLVGNGLHANKRIIPSLLKIDKLNSIQVVYNKENKFVNSEKKISYISSQHLPHADNFNLVIHATPPYLHLESLNKYFDYSNNHLIEKPITSSISSVFENKFKQKYNSKNIFEALMYFHHPVFEDIKKIVRSEKVVKINVSFKVPHSDFNHYRYKKNYGGGSLLDQGVYPISLVTFLFGKNIHMKNFKLNFKNDFDVDTSGVAVFSNSSKVEVIATWALGEEYENFLRIDTEESNYYFPNIFSKNEKEFYKYLLNENKEKNSVDVGIYNQFEIMYDDILTGNYSKFTYSKYENLILRYEIINKILKS